jgi:hypothetical protein
MPYFLLGRNVAHLMASLYKGHIIPAHDIHRCLGILITCKSRRDRIDAIRVIIIHADEGLCEGTPLPEVIHGLRARLSRKYPPRRLGSII